MFFDRPAAVAALMFLIGSATISISEASTPQCGATATEFSLHEIARHGAAEEILCHLTSGADIDALDALGNTPLGVAAAFGRLDMVEVLATSADLDAGRTPPIHAAMLSSVDSLGQIEEQSHEDNSSNFDRRIGILHVLLQSGADVEVRGVIGEGFLASLLHFGCFQHREIVASNKSSARRFMSLFEDVIDVNVEVDDQQTSGLLSLLNFPLDEMYDRNCLMEANEKISNASE